MLEGIKEKILPIKYPEITTDQTCAILWAILPLRENTLPWLYNYFVQIIGIGTYGVLDFDEADINWRDCPFFDFQFLDRKLLSSITKRRSIVEIFKDAIDQEYYLYTMLNQFYNPVSSHFNKRRFGHHTLIYGYNDVDKHFNVADFYADSKYDISKRIPYKLLESAFNDAFSCTNSDWFERGVLGRGIFDICYYLVFCKYIDYKYIFDLNLLRITLNDFLQSCNTIQRYEEEKERKEKEFVYGLRNYEHFKNYIEYIMESKTYYKTTRKSLNMLLDHKKVMIMRVLYMIDKKYINNGDCILKEYKNIMIIVRTMVNIFIKYDLTKDNKLLVKMLPLFDQLIEKEKEAISMILDNIIYS